MANGFRGKSSGLIFKLSLKKSLGLSTVLGFVFWGMGSWLYSYDSLSMVEAARKHALVVVLAGGRGRIETALQLFGLSNSTALFVVGAGPKTTKTALLKTFLSEKEIVALTNRAEAIFVETESRNTVENAYAVESFLRQNPEFKEIILITSSYHMRRSLLVFRELLSTTPIIYAFRGEKESIQDDNWFLSFAGISITFKELTKLAVAHVVLPQLATF